MHRSTHVVVGTLEHNGSSRLDEVTSPEPLATLVDTDVDCSAGKASRELKHILYIPLWRMAHKEGAQHCPKSHRVVLHTVCSPQERDILEHLLRGNEIIQEFRPV